jgi:hypothetical protein
MAALLVPLADIRPGERQRSLQVREIDDRAARRQVLHRV